MINYQYGWNPDDYDPRDFHYQLSSAPVKLQDVDLRATANLPGIFNQFSIGSCTGNSTSFHLTANVLNGHVKVATQISLPFSRLFLYYGGRQALGTVKQDSGAQIRDVFKAVANLGVCSEKTWPYNTKRFADKPSADAYAEAINYISLIYTRLNPTRQELVDCLLEGFSFVFGFKVFESFESQEVADTGEVEMPGPNERFVGGHAVCCVGYDLADDRFIVANSWGKEWGKDGFFRIPADYLCNPNLASDFWVSKLLL